MSSKSGFRWLTKVMCLAALGLTGFMTSDAAATTLYWNANTPFNWSWMGNGGSNNQWATTSGGAADTVWTDGSDAEFVAGSSDANFAANNGMVLVNTTKRPIVHSLTFDNPHYIIGTRLYGGFDGPLTFTGSDAYVDTREYDEAIACRISGGFTKMGTGTLTLNANNTATLTGAVTVAQGTLIVGAATLGELAIETGGLGTPSKVSIASGAVLELESNVTATVGSLYLNGVAQGPGTYDANTPGGYITGTGSLYIASVPEPGTLAILATGLFGLLAYAWRKRK